MHRCCRFGMPFLVFVLLTASACQVMDPVIRRTSTPISDRTPQPRVYATQANLFDDFSDPASGWEIGEYSVGSVGYMEGEYFVRVEDEDVIAWGQRFEWFGDATVEVTARQASGPESDDTGYGVMCRVNYDPDVDKLEGYAFLVSGDGYYAVVRFIGGDGQLLVGWEKSDTVRQGSGSNELEVICNAERLIFNVNGVRLAETRDESFSSGDVALIGATYDPGSAEFRFDNFSLTSP